MSTLSKLRRLVLRQDVSVREASRRLGGGASLDTNSPEDCLCLAKDRASWPGRRAPRAAGRRSRSPAQAGPGPRAIAGLRKTPSDATIHPHPDPLPPGEGQSYCPRKSVIVRPGAICSASVRSRSSRPSGSSTVMRPASTRVCT